MLWIIDWCGIFIVLVVYGVIVVVVVVLLIVEMLLCVVCGYGSWMMVGVCYCVLFIDCVFVGVVLVGGMIFLVFFVYFLLLLFLL